MGWLFFILFAALLLLGLWKLAKLPRQALELSAAAVLLALAGYAWQGSPSQAGSPVQAAEEAPLPAELAEGEVAKVVSGGDAAQLAETAEALVEARHTREGTNLMAQAVRKTPDDPEMWARLGSALVAHNQGQMSPAAKYAFETVARINPRHPAPPFFLGLSLVQAGKMDEAGEIWRKMLASAPADAPWKDDIVQRLTQIGQLDAPAEEKPAAGPAPQAK